MRKISKNTMWAIGIGAAIIFAILVVTVSNNYDIDIAFYPTNHKKQQTPVTTTPGTGSTGTTTNLAYNDALKKYGTNRIQFDTACQTRPNNVTYKAGTAVMFDNRSAGSHTITFNGTKYTIAGYGFRVVTMTATKYPTTVLIDCDKSQNVATVLIQK